MHTPKLFLVVQYQKAPLTYVKSMALHVVLMHRALLKTIGLNVSAMMGLTGMVK